MKIKSSNNQFEIRTMSKFENFLLCNYVYSINAPKGINWGCNDLTYHRVSDSVAELWIQRSEF